MPSASSGGFDFNRPTIVSLCILVGALTGLPTLIGALLAYVWRSESTAAAWEASHFAYHIRGFWMTVALVIVLGILAVLSFGLLMPLFGLVSIWLAVRAIVSLLRAQRQEPMTNPESVLW
jgi:uncharacterized membrane protein